MSHAPANTPTLRSLLVVERDFMLRRIIVGVVRELELAQPHEALSVEAAGRDLAGQHFDAVLLSLDSEGGALKLLADLRAGRCRSLPQTAVAVMADSCDAGLALHLRELDVRRVLLKPFKVKGVIETIAGLCAAAAPAPQTEGPAVPAGC